MNSTGTVPTRVLRQAADRMTDLLGPEGAARMRMTGVRTEPSGTATAYHLAFGELVSVCVVDEQPVTTALAGAA
jgi:hypothetical protein